MRMVNKCIDLHGRGRRVQTAGRLPLLRRQADFQVVLISNVIFRWRQQIVHCLRAQFKSYGLAALRLRQGVQQEKPLQLFQLIEDIVTLAIWSADYRSG
jgi:hypothetical protein